MVEWNGPYMEWSVYGMIRERLMGMLAVCDVNL